MHAAPWVLVGPSSVEDPHEDGGTALAGCGLTELIHHVAQSSFQNLGVTHLAGVGHRPSLASVPPNFDRSRAHCAKLKQTWAGLDQL